MKRHREGEMWPPYMPFEEKLVIMHTVRKSAEFAYRNYWIPTLTTVLYFVLIFLGPKIMESRQKSKHLKMSLFVWSTFLFAASTLGAYRVLPPTIEFISSKGIHAFLCEEGKIWGRENAMEYIQPRCEILGAGCLWLYIFCVSKIPETIDTVFLVLGKKKVIFLHWYHHVSVLWFCWVSWAHLAVGGSAYAAMNLVVHSIMYFWYALAAANGLFASGLKPGRFLSQLLTMLQILQMLVGAAVTFYIASVPVHDCLNYPTLNIFGVLLYTSYLYLFLRFFYMAYCKKKTKLKKF